jgi:hypothetical protein
MIHYVEKPSREELMRLYFEENLDKDAIALIYNVHPQTVGEWLVAEKLSKRSRREIPSYEKLYNMYITNLNTGK